MKLSFAKLGSSNSVSYDAEFEVTNSDVAVTFVFPNKKTLDMKFSSGDTALAMKKRLFDIFEIEYDHLKLRYGETELIDPLSICDSPALKGLKHFSINVAIEGFTEDKFIAALDKHKHPQLANSDLKSQIEKVASSTAIPDYEHEFAAAMSAAADVVVTFLLPNSQKLEKKLNSGETARAMKRLLFDLYDIEFDRLTLKFADTELIDPLSISDTPALRGLKAFSLTVTYDGPAEKFNK